MVSTQTENKQKKEKENHRNRVMGPSDLLFWGVATVVGAILFYFYKKWAAGGVCTHKADLKGKVIIITGANTGIGFETAKSLAGMGAHVILACRDKKRAQEAVKRIVDATPKAKGKVEYMELDLASLDSVREFVKNFKAKKFPALDILVNNAGLMWPPRMETEDGFEMQFGVNHLGHFLLTLLLVDELKKGKESRIVNVSSLASERPSFAYMNWEDLQWTNNYDRYKAYAQSKLANVLFTEELNRKLRGSGVTTYSLHPGAIITELGRYTNPVLRFLIGGPIAHIFPLKTAWQGAQTSLYTVVAPNIEKYSGMYFADCQVKKNPNPLSGDKEAAAKLWKISEELVKQKFE